MLQRAPGRSAMGAQLPGPVASAPEAQKRREVEERIFILDLLSPLARLRLADDCEKTTEHEGTRIYTDSRRPAGSHMRGTAASAGSGSSTLR